MNFKDEINEIKQQQEKERMDLEKQKQENMKREFRAKIQKVIDSIEEIKMNIKTLALGGGRKYKIIEKIAHLGSSGNHIARFDICTGYQCVRTTNLVLARSDPAGIGGIWMYVNQNAGKEVVLDKELMKLWEILESLGLQPFFDATGGNIVLGKGAGYLDLFVRI